MASQQPTPTNFTRILFESDVLDALRALQETLSRGQFGQAVEWLTAWQDLVDASSSPLNPLLDSLQEDDPQLVSTSLHVLNQLISAAPDPSHQSRIRNELKELKFEQLLGQVSVRWAKVAEIKKEIDTWFCGGQEEATCRQDSPEMEKSGDVEPVLSDLRCLLADDSAKEQRIRVVLGLLDTLRNVKNLQDAEQTLQRLGGSDKKENILSPPPPVAPPPPPRLGPPGPATMSPPPPPPPPNLGKGPPPPPPPMGLSKPVSTELPSCMKPKKIPDKDVKMKTLMWSKLPPSALTNEGKESVWGLLASSEPRGFSLDFEVIEGMFSLSSTNANNADLGSPAVNFKKKDTLVDLLTPKRSQNVTIALKRFKNLEDVLTNIRENNFEAFELEMLRALKGILPDEEEVDALTRYSGDIGLLAPACSFFLQILSIPEYRLRIDCMSYRLEFRCSMDEIVPQLEAVNAASREILKSGALKRLLLLLVNIGNYLNGATAHGNAAGFKLNSLWKMIDLKAAKGGASLLHALAKMDEDLLKELQNELQTVKKASEVSLEETKASLRQLTDQADRLTKLVANKQDRYFLEMKTYLKEEAQEELSGVQGLVVDLAQSQEQLAAYFCENKSSFKAEECFKIFSNFIARLQVAVQENEERSQRAAKKTKQTGSNESVQARDGKEVPSEERLFATLEKAIPTKVSRRRSSVRTSLEFSRERDIEAESRMKRIRMRAEEEEKSPDEKDESPTDTPRIIRRPRRSLQVEGASTLTDFMERLQATSFGRAPLPPSTVPEENISVAIPSESDGCTSTPSTSPKSSDEGFESEKDKETEATGEKLTSQSTEIQQPPFTCTLGRRTTAATDAKTPRLVSITTTGTPPNPTKSLPRPTQLARPRVIPSRIAAPQPLKPTNGENSLPKTKTLPRPSPPSSLIRKSQTVPRASTMTPVAKPPSQRRSLPVSTPVKPQPRPVAAPRKTAIPSKNLSLTRTTEAAKPPPVSTSARPSLIKTGSLSQRPSLKGLDAVETPRPLKKTGSTTSTIKPKWV